MTERDQQIIDLYLHHPEMTVKQIAEQFNVSTATVTRIARINNIPRRQGVSHYIDESQLQAIVEEYKAGGSMLAIQKKYGISWQRLKALIADCPHRSAAQRLNTELNEDYFACIDSADKAYWLGWIISDGCITYNPEKSRYDLSISLQERDEHILHLLEQDLGVTDKVTVFNAKYKRFALSCKKLVTDLVNLGITQNKTFTVTVPTIDPQFYPALIRGLFDGDGGFTVYVRATGQYCQELSFCGNEAVVTWFRDTLVQSIPGLKCNAVTNEASIKRVRWSSKKDICLIRDYMYANHNDHYLKRKHDLIYANTEVSN